MTAPRCGTCRFFQVENAAARMGSLALYAGTTGECRRYPPRMVAGADRAKSGYFASGLPAPEWPILAEAEWCGEFAAVESASA